MNRGAQRARHGSRRQRDIEALAVERARKLAVPDGVTSTPAAQDAWGRVAAEIRQRLRPTAWDLYLCQLPLVGEKRQALYIAGPPAVAEWTRRKYAKAVGDLVREVTDYKGLFVCDKEEQ